MTRNCLLTQQDVSFPENVRLISATNERGVIGYCNDEFIEVSGYAREELLSKAHNVDRHSDTLPQIFAQMWVYLKAGKAGMGIVKNRCKNGDFYWVSTYVTPIFESDKIVDYESVRVKPTESQFRRAVMLYARLREGRVSENFIESAQRLVKDFAPLSLGVCASFLLFYVGSHAYALAFSSLCIVAQAFWARRAIHHELISAPNVFDSELVARTCTESVGNFALLQMALIAEAARVRTVLSRLSDYADQVAGQAGKKDALVNDSKAALQEQNVKIDLAAAATQEMATSISQVASHVQQTADEASQASSLALEEGHQAQRSRSVVESVAISVANISASVEALADESQSIQQAASMISAIAQQTNLLALNAAIEAARAGEQDHGFAVVSDEVRALAFKTQESTEVIQSAISSLQAGAGRAIEVARKGVLEAHTEVECVVQTEEALKGITEVCERIRHMPEQMAAAAEQQSAVAEEIFSHISDISSVAEQNFGITNQSAILGGELSLTSKSLHVLVARFNR